MNTYLLSIRPAKIQFVDQGPELENFYSQDDLDTFSDSLKDPQRDLDVSELSLRRSQTASTNRTSPSPVTKSPVDQYYHYSSRPVLSPTSTLNSGSNPRSPLKRALPDDAFGPAPQRRVDTWQSRVTDAVRPSNSAYVLYDTPKALHSYEHDSIQSPPLGDHPRTIKIVEAECRRLADHNAAAIPEDSELLTPTIWKKNFYWPNKYTTNQCACLMRYFIEKLAPWVRKFLCLRK